MWIASTSASRRSPSNIPRGKKPFCVQQYITNPLLMRNCKFDIRIYVLLTSLDPLAIYMFDDGLVRLATERYTEHPRSAAESCIHITNFAVNSKNTAKFMYNDDVNSCNGHKWRLKCLWPALMKAGWLTVGDVGLILEQMEQVVIKSILASLDQTREEFRKLANKSSYNCHKILGYDLIIDQSLKVHLLEVNARPALLDDDLDKTVNRPLVNEVVRIVGYNIPSSMRQWCNFIRKKFGLQHGGADSQVTFEPKLYSKELLVDDEEKQRILAKPENCPRDAYLYSILRDLSCSDVRVLVKMEEEFGQLRGFSRIFPTETSHRYFKFMTPPISYYDKLLDAYETKYHANRNEGIELINSLCAKNIHL